jgi:hypothetical protein
VIYAVSYKNTKNELKGAGKKFSLQVPGSLPNLLSLPLGMQYCPCISLMTTKYIAFHLHDTVRLGFSVVFEKKV